MTECSRLGKWELSSTEVQGTWPSCLSVQKEGVVSYMYKHNQNIHMGGLRVRTERTTRQKWDTRRGKLGKRKGDFIPRIKYTLGLAWLESRDEWGRNERERGMEGAGNTHEGPRRSVLRS